MDAPILSARAFCGLAVGFLFGIFAFGCDGGPIGPGVDDEGPLRIHPVLESAVAPGLLDLDSIHVVVREAGGGSILSDTVLAYEGNPGTVLRWIFEVGSLPSGVRVDAEARAGGTAMFAGGIDTEIVDEAPGGPPVIRDLVMSFVGPGSDAVSVTVAPGEALLGFGETLQFSVTGTDQDGNVIEEVLAVWSSSDPEFAPISREALLLAPDEPGSVQVTALTPRGLSDQAEVEIQDTTPPEPVATSATIEASPAEAEADGDATSLITVRVFDQDGAPMPAGGDAVTLATDLGTLTPVADLGDGTYTAELRSTEAGTATVTGTLNGTDIDDQAQVAFVDDGGPVDPVATSATIEASPAEAEADGDATSLITVRVFDQDGAPMPAGGDAVTLATDLGTLTPVADLGDGTYTAELRSTEAGTATVTGTLNGTDIDDQAQVAFVDDGGPVDPVATSATIEASPAEVEADGDAASLITVRVFDQDGAPMPAGGDAVTLATDLGTLTPVADLGDGTYTAELRSTEAGTATVTGTLNGTDIDDQAQVAFVDDGGPVDPVATSATIEASPAEVEADGDAASLITVRVFDQDGAPMPAGGDAVTLATDLGTLTTVADQGDGTYTAELRSTVAGTANVTGTLNGTDIDDQAQVVFVDDGGPVEPVATFATIEASPAEVEADGDAASLITVRVFDQDGAPMPRAATRSPSPPTSAPSPPSRTWATAPTRPSSGAPRPAPPTSRAP
jgi:protocatechuate 3,4-dioxygenase beta subunit